MPNEQVAWTDSGVRPVPASKQTITRPSAAVKKAGAWAGPAAGKGSGVKNDQYKLDKGEKEKQAEELAVHLAEELGRAQEALMQIQQVTTQTHACAQSPAQRDC